MCSEVGNAALKQTVLSLFAEYNHGTTATEKNYSEICRLFLISRILILCFCNKQLIFSRKIFLKSPLGLFFNAESSSEDLKYGCFALVQGGLTF